MSDTAHILAIHRRPRQLDALLYATSRVLDIPALSGATTMGGSFIAIVEAPADRAQNQADRLGSGLIGARVALTEASLTEALTDMTDVDPAPVLAQLAAAS